MFTETRLCILQTRPERGDEMEHEFIQKELWIDGMISDRSELKLEILLNELVGIKNAKANYVDSKVSFLYDPNKINLKSIISAIKTLGLMASENHPQSKSQKSAGTPAEQAPLPATSADSELYIKKVLRIDGMTCANCEIKIEKRLRALEGVREANVSYNNGSAKIVYDPRIITRSRIVDEIEKLDYKVLSGQNKDAVNTKKSGAKPSDKMPINQLLGIIIVIIAIFVLIRNTIGFNFIPAISQNMGLGILFVVGLITSIHCIAMCGGINLSQCVSYDTPPNASRLSKLRPSLMYNAGRVISYTVVGGVVGAIGSVISFSGMAKGVVAILSGVFMLIMGLNMLNIFPWLRKLTPRMPKIFGRSIHGGGKKGPFIVGLLNGLMPCGPLQAMQIYALGTGSFAAGALSMLVFSLGTVPLMFGFGAVSSFLSGKFTKKMMKVSAVLVMILGVIMLNRGFTLSGLDVIGGIAAKSAPNSVFVAKIDGNIQTITTKLGAGYTPITVQKGVPVKWTIQADAGSINGCNQTMVIPKLNITKKLVPGDNVITFTPSETGNISYSCSMGMIRSNISVVSDLTDTKETSQAKSDGQVATTAGGMSCCKTRFNKEVRI